MQVRTHIPVSLDLSVVVSQTTGPRDIPHRRGLEFGTGPLVPQSRGPVPDPETVPLHYMNFLISRDQSGGVISLSIWIHHSTSFDEVI